MILEFDFSEEKKKEPREGYIPPKTSILAHESVKEMKAEHYLKIQKALEELKVGGTYVEIAEKCSLDPIQVGRRLSEMEASGIVYNVGVTRPTPTGRKAQVRQLTSLGKEEIAPIVKKEKRKYIQKTKPTTQYTVNSII